MVFIVKHYAADVQYTCDTGFLVKNKDVVHDALKALINSSKVIGGIIISVLLVH
jgi:myosin heavy subunit